MTRATEIRRAREDDSEEIADIIRSLGSEPVGLPAAMSPERVREWLRRLGDQGARRRGLATALAEELLEFARERGYRRIRGRLPDGNEPALSFLSSIGAMVPLRNPDMSFELPL
ncbi:GNAT family N-acetyltransferase [bacterium]|nr:MAG: GNAT family N-acetyltransferase [bacterium]